MPDQDTQVIISGGGLVGLSAAMFLAQHGIASLVVERLRETSTLPRAAFFHMRTLELFREAGIEPEVREQSERDFEPDGAVVAVESLAGKQLAAFIPSLNEGVEALSPCRRIFVTQPGLEPILRRRAEQGGARVMNGHEVVSVAQDADGVTATVKDIGTGAEKHLRARYLIAAEGGRSRVREQLGIAMDGHGVFSHSVTIYFRADVAPYLKGRNLSVIYVVNPVLSGFFRFDRDGKRGFLAVNVVGDPRADLERAKNVAADTSDARLIELVRAAVGADIPVELEGFSRWRCTADIAQRYQDRRIFLAGDAAHLMPPTGGFGGNTGVHDAHNLAWKLALVLKGIAGSALLDTYETERRPAGHFTVEQAYTRYVTRTAPYLGATDYQPVGGDFDIELGSVYRSAAMMSEPGAPEVHEDPHHSRGRPGTRAPHLWFTRNGKRVSTLDLFGKGFVLLAGARGRPWADASRAAASAFPGLKLDAHVMDAEEFAGACGIDAAGAVLVRPDGFVAWRSTTEAGDDAVDVLPGVLAKILSRA